MQSLIFQLLINYEIVISLKLILIHCCQEIEQNIAVFWLNFTRRNILFRKLWYIFMNLCNDICRHQNFLRQCLWIRSARLVSVPISPHIYIIWRTLRKKCFYIWPICCGGRKASCFFNSENHNNIGIPSHTFEVQLLTFGILY